MNEYMYNFRFTKKKFMDIYLFINILNRST